MSLLLSYCLNIIIPSAATSSTIYYLLNIYWLMVVMCDVLHFTVLDHLPLPET